MAQEIQIQGVNLGKQRSFFVGLLLTIITLGIYGLFWYYQVNDELKNIGVAKGDQKLATSSPASSVAAILFGGWIIIPPYISTYNYLHRIKRAQQLSGLPESAQVNTGAAFLCYFFGFLIIPIFVYYAIVTKHQNAALRAAAGQQSPALASAPAWPPAYGPPPVVGSSTPPLPAVGTPSPPRSDAPPPPAPGTAPPAQATTTLPPAAAVTQTASSAMDTVFCESCGQRLNAEARFCGACGASTT